MFEYYLKASNKKLMSIILDDSQILAVEDGSVNIDYIGEISGNTGYHANLLMTRELTAQENQILLPILINKPTTPVRTWWI